MPAELICFEERCRARFPITGVIYNCPHCGGLLEVWYPPPDARYRQRIAEFHMYAAGLDEPGRSP